MPESIVFCILAPTIIGAADFLSCRRDGWPGFSAYRWLVQAGCMSVRHPVAGASLQFSFGCRSDRLLAGYPTELLLGCSSTILTAIDCSTLAEGACRMRP